MKTAYLVLGPEGSGTRMLTQAFLRLGAYGDGGHRQRLDDLAFADLPNTIVFRQSLPHGKTWPDCTTICERLRAAGYERLVPILIVRDRAITARSRFRANPFVIRKRAQDRISYGIDLVYRQLAAAGLFPLAVHYEPFVEHEEVRRAFFQQLGLPLPEMGFYDANAKHLGWRGVAREA